MSSTYPKGFRLQSYSYFIHCVKFVVTNFKIKYIGPALSSKYMAVVLMCTDFAVLEIIKLKVSRYYSKTESIQLILYSRSTDC
jgi:hypothetical protein